MSNDADNKGCLYQAAFLIAVAGSIFWIYFGINVFSSWPFVLAAPLVPLGGLILSWYKQRIGGPLIILSGFLPIIILTSMPKQDFEIFGVIILSIFVTLPLCVSGIVISIALSKEKRKKLKRGRKYLALVAIKGKVGWFCEKCDAEVAKTDKICPKCGLEFV